MCKDAPEQESPPLVSVVIVNYNSGVYLAGCVKSLMNCSYPRKELIVVDNASGDGSIAQLEDLNAEVKIVRNAANLGYSRGCNIGIGMCKGKFVIIMNPDTLVEPGCLQALVNASQRYPQAAFLQPKILLMDNPRLLNSAGNMIHIAGFGVCRGIGTPDGGFQKESEVCYTSGACTLARMRAVQDIGPMEELFFAYGEDKDWGWRALMDGWQSIFVPSAKVLHSWSPTLGDSPAKFYLLEFERWLSILKNYSGRTLLLLAPVLVLVELSVFLYATLKGWLAKKIQTYADLLRVWRVVAERRRTLQNRRLVPDRLVLRRFVANVEHPYIGPVGHVLNHLVCWLFARVGRWI